MDATTLWRRFNLASDEIEKLHAAQNGLCAICQRPLELGKPSVCIDHCHKTGIVRGLICFLCNRAIGLLKDDPCLLRAAAAYLLNPPAPLVIGLRHGHIGRATKKHGKIRKAAFFRRGEIASGGALYLCGCRDCGARPQKVCPAHGQPVVTD